MIQTKKYIRKPLNVEAVRVTAKNFLELTFWCRGSIRDRQGNVPDQDSINPQEQLIHVPVSNPRDDRQAQARVGDWILKNEKGYKVYTDKAFKNSFDLVAEEQEKQPEEPVTPEPAEPTPSEPTPAEPTPAEPAVAPSQPPTEAQAA